MRATSCAKTAAASEWRKSARTRSSRPFTAKARVWQEMTSAIWRMVIRPSRLTACCSEMIGVRGK